MRRASRAGVQQSICACALSMLLLTASGMLAVPQPLHATDSIAEQATQRAEARAQAMQWLERMALAVEQLNYRGQFVYQQGNVVRLLRIEHHRDHRGVRERLYSHDDRQLEILRNNNLVQASSPANRSEPMLNYSQFTRLPASHLLRDSSHYRFQLGNEHDIAGYRARHIAILPRDSLRYGFAYWLEVRTGMLLKQQLLNSDGDVLEQLLFTDIEMGQPDDGQVLAGPVLPARQRASSGLIRVSPDSGGMAQGLQRQSDNDSSDADEALLPSSASGLVDDLSGLPPARKWSEQSARSMLPGGQQGATRSAVPGRPAWQCVNPPRGYSLVAHQQSRLENGELLDHLLYSDGLSQISVYIEQRRARTERSGSGDNELPASRVGVMNVYRRQLDSVSITALGAAPYRTLRMLGGSMVQLSSTVSGAVKPAQ